ncbi:hypothetical protein XA68_12270 [Ophiocordyceps unilateralis]|uniref:Uncharacterized protein n=1 Tax=Ophiocordyceps unilateralis TaxID=268505 RepID=A0A2A9PF10_OPHUN|nr:hypothetical protein XA68_12270 [Ophiocordyceps unilateralis]
MIRSLPADLQVRAAVLSPVGTGYRYELAHLMSFALHEPSQATDIYAFLYQEVPRHRPLAPAPPAGGLKRRASTFSPPASTPDARRPPHRDASPLSLP